MEDRSRLRVRWALSFPSDALAITESLEYGVRHVLVAEVARGKLVSGCERVGRVLGTATMTSYPLVWACRGSDNVHSLPRMNRQAAIVRSLSRIFGDRVGERMLGR